jgi:hypothetical protein
MLNYVKLNKESVTKKTSQLQNTHQSTIPVYQAACDLSPQLCATAQINAAEAVMNGCLMYHVCAYQPLHNY